MKANSKLTTYLIAWVSCLALAACSGHDFIQTVDGGGVDGGGVDGGGVDGGIVTQTDQFLQAAAGKTDILFVIDHSGSMKDEQDSLAQSFQDLIAGLTQIGGDYQIAITSTTADDFEPYTAYRVNDCDKTDRLPNGAFLMTPGQFLAFGQNPTILSSQTMSAADMERYFTENVALGTCGSGFESGIKSVIDTLTNESGSGFLRADAQLDVVFVSDEDDCTDPYDVRTYVLGQNDSLSQGKCHDQTIIDTVLTDVGSLLGQISGIKSNFRTHSIIWIPGDAQGVALFPGTRYRDATTGFLGSINQNFSALATELGQQLAEPLSDFTLSRIPVPATIEVTVNGTLLPSVGAIVHWEYRAPRTVHFFDVATDVPAGAEIFIRYEVQ